MKTNIKTTEGSEIAFDTQLFAQNIHHILLTRERSAKINFSFVTVSRLARSQSHFSQFWISKVQTSPSQAVKLDNNSIQKKKFHKFTRF